MAMETTRNTMVGGFMLVGLILAGWLLWIFGESPTWLGSPGYEVAVRVEGLYGITESTPVELNGVTIGRVRRVEFVNPSRPRDVQIVALISKQYDVPFGVIAKVQPGSLGFARGRVSLVPRIDTDAPLARDGSAKIKGEMVSAFSDLLPPEMLNSVEHAFRNVGDLAHALVPAATDVRKLVESRPASQVDAPTTQPGEALMANLSTVIERADQTFKSINTITADPKFKADLLATADNIRGASERAVAAVDNIHSASETLKTDLPAISAELKGAIGDVRADIHAIAQQIMPAMDALSAAMTAANTFMRQLSEGDGTAAKLARDSRLYEGLVLATQRLTDLIDSFRRMTKIWEDDHSAIRIRGAPL